VKRPSQRPLETAPINGIAALLRSRNPVERGGGLRGLGSLASRAEKIAILRETLDGADAGTKSRALSLLKTVGGADAVALAAGVLQGGGPSWLRSQAASVLGDLGDPAALGPLLDVSREEDLQVRAYAVAALDQLGHAAPLRETLTALAGLLDHPDGRKREDAVELLSTFRTPAVLPALAVALVDPTNSRIREAAADALGRTRRLEAVPYLEGALGDSEPGVREAARRALDAIREARR
jgi:HEAT repeat protein